MDKTTIFIAISGMFAIAFIGFFLTKSEGWGRYTSALFILLLVLFIASVAFFQDMISGGYFVNLLALMAGFAGGLLTAKEA